jgi:hypothetical protein
VRYGARLSASLADLGVEDVGLSQKAGDEFSGEVASFSADVTFYRGPSGPSHWFVTRQGVGQRQ